MVYFCRNESPLLCLACTSVFHYTNHSNHSSLIHDSMKKTLSKGEFIWMNENAFVYVL